MGFLSSKTVHETNSLWGAILLPGAFCDNLVFGD